MKLTRLLRERKFFFTMLTAIVLQLSAYGDRPNPCLNVPITGDWYECNEHLRPDFVPVCPTSHCDVFQVSGIYHDRCVKDKLPQYSPVPSLDCCNPVTNKWIQYMPGYENVGLNDIVADCQDESIGFGKPWTLGTCYCCCACFADQTRIGIPGGVKQVKDFKKGDSVRTAKMNVGHDGKISFDWVESKIDVSVGAGGNEPAMVYIEFGNDQSLIVSPDQVLMLSNGKLVQARTLVPGAGLESDMFLVDENANPLVIKTVSIGSYTGGLHHIGMNKGRKEGIDGHLVLAEGAVAGDIYLQAQFNGLDKETKLDNHDALPKLGTNEYHAQAQVTGCMKGNGLYSTQEQVALPLSFKLFPITDDSIPYGAKSYFTNAQAQDIFNSFNQQAIDNKTKYGIVEHFIKLFKGFYPEINIYLDWYRMMPNIYGFESYGQKTILLSGGLVRTEGVSSDVLALMIGNAIGRFYGGEPLDVDDYACLGNADYFGTGEVTREIWIGDDWFDNTQDGINGITTFFNAISPEHANGSNNCDDPSIDCRKKTMMAAFIGSSLPACAGGPEPVLLQLQSASVNGTQIDLTFNEGLSLTSAQNIENYTLFPEGKILSVTVDSVKNFVAHVIVDELTPGFKYEIKVSNLISAFGSGLNPGFTTAEFTVDKSSKEDL